MIAHKFDIYNLTSQGQLKKPVDILVEYMIMEGTTDGNLPAVTVYGYKSGETEKVTLIDGFTLQASEETTHRMMAQIIKVDTDPTIIMIKAVISNMEYFERLKYIGMKAKNVELPIGDSTTSRKTLYMFPLTYGGTGEGALVQASLIDKVADYDVHKAYYELKTHQSHIIFGREGWEDSNIREQYLALDSESFTVGYFFKVTGDTVTAARFGYEDPLLTGRISYGSANPQKLNFDVSGPQDGTYVNYNNDNSATINLDGSDVVKDSVFYVAFTHHKPVMVPDYETKPHVEVAGTFTVDIRLYDITKNKFYHKVESEYIYKSSVPGFSPAYFDSWTNVRSAWNPIAYSGYELCSRYGSTRHDIWGYTPDPSNEEVTTMQLGPLSVFGGTVTDELFKALIEGKYMKLGGFDFLYDMRLFSNSIETETDSNDPYTIGLLNSDLSAESVDLSAIDISTPIT